MPKNYSNFQPYLPFNVLNHTQLWLAIDECTQKTVLIKALQQGYNAMQYQQLCQEYQVYLRLQNLANNKKKYFAKLLDVKIDNTENWLILEFYQGVTLRQLMVENQLELKVKITYLIELCRAINILHTQGFIHCDIKPSNVLITDNQLKLVDFGLSKSRDKMPVLSNITAGTPAYMSPEQFIGENVTYQSDYYSLGVVMYECLVGKQPFIAKELENWAVAHCQQPLANITYFTHEINEQLQHIFKGLLAKRAENRPKNLAPIMRILKNLLKT